MPRKLKNLPSERGKKKKPCCREKGFNYLTSLIPRKKLPKQPDTYKILPKQPNNLSDRQKLQSSINEIKRWHIHQITKIKKISRMQ